MSVIDYTNGDRWGHSLHYDTFREVHDGESWLSILYDKFKKIRRYSVLVHSSEAIRVGDTFRYRTRSGINNAKIYDVVWFHDPKDMYKLFIRIQG